MESFRVIEVGLAWHIGSGEKFRIGIDTWVGCREGYDLPREVLTTLNECGILYLNQVTYE